MKRESPPVKIFITAAERPSTWYRVHMPLLISTIPTNKKTHSKHNKILLVWFLQNAEPFRTGCKAGSAAVFCWLGSDLLAVNSDLICLRIYGKHRRAVVPYHILFADTAAAVYRDNRFFLVRMRL